MLKHFAIDCTRVSKVVDIEFYQMNMLEITELLRKLDPDSGDVDLFPSWTKTVANPHRAKGFFSRVLQALFLGEHGVDSLNVDHQITSLSGGMPPKHRIAMMFLPASTRVRGDETVDGALSIMTQIAKDALPNFHVIEVSGRTTSNALAEGRVKAEIENARIRGQSVLILSAGMAQRSFSVSEITELYLAFDTGSSASVIQKMSRALTPGLHSKVGRIFSLSFDPNRDDKFDALILQTATNYMKKHPEKSLHDALRLVLSTIDIFRCLPDGSIRLNVDTYLDQLFHRGSFERFIGKTADFSRLTTADIVALATGNSDVEHNQKQEAADRGKTRHLPSKKAKYMTEKDHSDKDEQKAREVITTIAQNIDFLFEATNTTRVESLLAAVRSDSELCDCVKEEFGVPIQTIAMLFEKRVINAQQIELVAEHGRVRH